MTAAGADVPAVPARAKLNLYLHVTGRRADGYHTIESFVVFAALADALAVRPAPAGTFVLEVFGPFADAPGVESPDNLVLRAARALDAHAGGGRGCAIALTKNIPVAAGLGGGSADAAAALGALARLWGIADAPLADIGLALGADVPVCLAGRPSRVGGVGEAVSPAPAPPPGAGLVLANPGVAVETGAVFRGFDARPAPPPRAVPAAPPSGFPDAATLARFLAVTANDLTEAARAAAAAIGAVLTALASMPGCRLARMAGSGATCFALHDDAAAAAAAARALAAAHPGWWVWAGTFAAD